MSEPDKLIPILEAANKKKQHLPSRKASTAIFMAILFLIGVYSVPLAGVSDTAQSVGLYLTQAYDQSFNSVNLTFSLFLIATLVLGIPSNYIIARVGVRGGLIICVMLLTVGTCMRVMLNQSFYWMQVGQFIAGMGAPLAQNGIFFYCHNTFSKKDVP